MKRAAVPPRRSGACVRAEPGFAAALLALVAMTVSRGARAQVHWDLGGSVGVSGESPSSRPAHAPGSWVGPSAEVHGDVAVLPMVRGGVHASFDLWSTSGLPPRDTAEAGIQLRFAPPLLGAPWRAWAVVGLGYAVASVPEHAALTPGLPMVPGASGESVRVPFGAGIAYRAWSGWEAFLELGASLGVAFAGPLFDAPGRDCASPYLGRDVIALSARLGVNSNR